MSAYAQCPHCGHPSVTPRGDYGVTQLCRQCGEKFVVIISPESGTPDERESPMIDSSDPSRENAASVAGL